MADEEKQNEQEQEQTEETASEESSDKEQEQASGENENASEQDDSAEEVEVPEQFKDLVERIENMTVIELNDFVKTLEKKFGVSAAAVAAAPAGGGDAEGGGEEQDEFTVNLASVGDQKIQVIKVVREVLGLGLKEAKELVEGAPADVKSGVKKEEADEIKGKLEEAGASVELK